MMSNCPAADVAAALLQARRPQHDTVLEVLRRARDVRGVAWHPTGFVVAKLYAEGSLALRLHIWPADARCYGEPLWPAHDHVFALHSHVLLGAVCSADYRLRDDAGGPQRRYFVEYHPGTSRSELVADGARVVVEATGTRVTEAGGHYTVAEGAFHASSAAEGTLAATVVATWKGARVRPAVLGPADGPTRIAVRRVPVPRERWASMLGEVVAGVCATTHD